ncbi:GNAT family N-acetyltransferase [Neobacillus sp. SuZ13]|uniref:GNAT family N-acetyltransferase n=1 Tax=Neobacillus sp. SuZ13 TaxID=3047875 RepID=UPI0024C08FA3|nr:GNAT family N-acetyltransferase [Neobacillus sp. SuZ13]WHY69727.1 GNAT family N-acetyltransferase [Neobacillus sp. SuZ13]
MLIRYKKSYKKVAMGLLSFMPNEKNLQRLQSTMNLYETAQDHQLFLWREDEGLVGLVGVLFVNEHLMQIQHITLNPSHRGQELGKKMIMNLKELNPDILFIPHDNTKEFCGKYDINNSFNTRCSDTSA